MSNVGNVSLKCYTALKYSKQFQWTGCGFHCGLTSPQVCISLSRETLLSQWHLTITEQEAAECSCTTYSLSPDTQIHSSKGELKCAALVLALPPSFGQRGNGCFPSPATALWLNWSGLLDLSVCARLCVPIRHLLKQSWTGRVNCLKWKGIHWREVDITQSEESKRRRYNFPCVDISQVSIEI